MRKVDGEELKISFSAKYMMDALKALIVQRLKLALLGQ